ncbi:DnaJ C-terminal domain-containing protein [Streptosporangium vulgare]|uniref:DnaJ C-terminal domain-containing protein n=1 Tax=Streptosporangium vulgare TaxID=46190 RepID=A0ABV5TM53_9ACTN
MNEAPYTQDLEESLAAANTCESLATVLRQLHARADNPSLRTLERWAANRPGAATLSKSTVADMLKGRRFPKKTVLITFVQACGVNEVTPWRLAWERIADSEHNRSDTQTPRLERLREEVLTEAHQQANTIIIEAKNMANQIVTDAHARAADIIKKAQNATYRAASPKEVPWKGEQAPRLGKSLVSEDKGTPSSNESSLPLLNRRDVNIATVARPRRGKDLEFEVLLTLNEAVEGITLSLQLPKTDLCALCSGIGARVGTLPRICPMCVIRRTTDRNHESSSPSDRCQDCGDRGFVINYPCPVCDGSGRGKTATTRTIQARIPGGIGDGQRALLRGQGEPGESGGQNGDLYILVKITRHERFGRHGDDLTITIPVTSKKVEQGGEIEILPFHGGLITLRIPAGTPNGRTFQVRGHGLPRKDGTRGDLLVTIDTGKPLKPTDLLDEARRRDLQT